jgi:hypothetical protein
MTGFQVWSITAISQHNSILATLLEGRSAFQQISCLIFIRIKNVSSKILHEEHLVLEETLAHCTRDNNRAHNLFALYMSMTQLSAGKVMVDSLLGHIWTLNCQVYVKNETCTLFPVLN